MWLQIPFFCGQASPCWEEGSNWALQQAKYNLLNEYFLVGLNEQMEKFIQLLDYQLPHVFKVVLEDEFRNTLRGYSCLKSFKLQYFVKPKLRISNDILYLKEKHFKPYAK